MVIYIPCVFTRVLRVRFVGPSLAQNMIHSPVGWALAQQTIHPPPTVVDPTMPQDVYKYFNIMYSSRMDPQ